MSRILLFDETGGAERLSTTEAKDANIGSGTSTARLSISTTVTITTGPILGPTRCRPTSVSPSNGSFSLDPNATFSQTVSTGLSRIPMALSDGLQNFTVLTYDATNNDCNSSTGIGPQAFVNDDLSTTGGQFTILISDSADPSGTGAPGCTLPAISGLYYYI